MAFFSEKYTFFPRILIFFLVSQNFSRFSWNFVNHIPRKNERWHRVGIFNFLCTSVKINKNVDKHFRKCWFFIKKFVYKCNKLKGKKFVFAYFEFTSQWILLCELVYPKAFKWNLKPNYNERSFLWVRD